jgi:transcriptional regulator with XRE-family HTH domain
LPIPPKFKEYRLNAGLTQQEAAAKLGRTASAVQKWEQGMNSPTMNDIHRLAEIYRVKPSVFFEDDDLSSSVTDATRIFVDGGVLANIPPNDRQRILGYLRECAEAFQVLPEGFSTHWVKCMKAAAATLACRRIGRVHRRGGRDKKTHR